MNGIAKQVVALLQFSLSGLEKAGRFTTIQRLISNLHSQAEDLVYNVIVDLKLQRPSTSNCTTDAMAADLNAINLPLLWQSVDTLCQHLSDELLKPMLHQIDVVDGMVVRFRLVKDLKISKTSMT